ncbi:MAG: hypothetical protein D6798_13845 [Deltaproteobacteria bacterium]|nr:MAG: hypothetical protein D6798_13845 [Deltaproteobacteria bacterium]
MRASTCLITVAAGIALAACKNDSTLGRVTSTGDADLVTIEGRVCDPDRGTWLEGATVYMNLFTEDGVFYDTRMDETDADGVFQLTDIPVSGIQPIYVQYGNKVIDQYQVEAPAGDTFITLPDPDCGGGDAAFAVVSGDYDDLAAALQTFGYGDFDVINGLTGEELVQFLSSEAAMAGYDAILFGGGHLEEDVIYDTDGTDVAGNVPAVREAIRNYVDGGGTIVVTDWSYDIAEQVWPEAVDFLGDDTEPDAAQKGETGTVTAAVVDATMAGTVGRDEVEVAFDMFEFPVIESAGEGSTVILRGDVQWREGQQVHTLSDKPLLVRFPSGSGTVWVSTFRFGPNSDTSAKPVVRALLDSL